MAVHLNSGACQPACGSEYYEALTAIRANVQCAACLKVDVALITAPVYTPYVAPLKKKRAATVCPKCTGTGYIPAFKSTMSGICFRCDGIGKV